MELRSRVADLGMLAAGSLLALALACGRDADTSGKSSEAPAGGSPVAARLNGEPITIDDLQDSFAGPMRGDARHALDTAVARRLVAQEARRRGLDATSAVQAQIAALHRDAAAREDALLRDALQAALDAQQTVSEEELRQHYEQMPARFAEPQLRLRLVAFPSAEAAQAEDERLGADGRLDPATSEEIGPATVEELMQRRMFGTMRLREPGQRIVVPREGDFALLELEERLPPTPLPFEKVREQIENQVRSQHAGEAFAKLVEELRAKARVEIDEAVLNDDAAWPQPRGEAARLRRPGP